MRTLCKEAFPYLVLEGGGLGLEHEVGDDGSDEEHKDEPDAKEGAEDLERAPPAEGVPLHIREELLLVLIQAVARHVQGTAGAGAPGPAPGANDTAMHRKKRNQIQAMWCCALEHNPRG